MFCLIGTNTNKKHHKRGIYNPSMILSPKMLATTSLEADLGETQSLIVFVLLKTIFGSLQLLHSVATNFIKHTRSQKRPNK